MTALAIDTSVLLAIFKGEADGERWLAGLQQRAATCALWISPVVLAEVRSFFASDIACLEALHDLGIATQSLTDDASLLAGKIFREYRRQGGPRTTILPDFLVAAHAAVQTGALATTDRGYLRTYFPDLTVWSP
jgi:predicted nucleic acid-binding protein